MKDAMTDSSIKECTNEDFLHSDSPYRAIDGRMYRYGNDLTSTG